MQEWTGGYGDGRGFAALLVGDGPWADEAAEAVALAGGRVAATLGWEALADGLGGGALLVVETRDVAEAVLADGLALIEAAALPVVVALGESQIDVVTAALAPGGVQFLCDPDMAERVAAIALAAGLLDRPEGRVRENEAAQLRRLNDEVARIAEVLARLTTRERPAADAPLRQVEDRRNSFAVEPLAEAVSPEAIRRVIRARRMRDEFLGAGLFEDPAWDMILDLFAAGLERAEVSVSSLCIAAAVAPTTALRWIGKMTDAGLFERQPDPFDRRRVMMALSPAAAGGMRRYVAAVKRAGLGVV